MASTKASVVPLCQAASAKAALSDEAISTASSRRCTDSRTMASAPTATGVRSARRSRRSATSLRSTSIAVASLARPAGG